MGDSTARRKTTDPKKREIELTNAAYDLAMERIRSNEISDSLLSLLIRQGSSTGAAAKERMIAQTAMFNAKVDAIKEDARSSELFEEAIAAIQRYSGNRPKRGVDDEAL